ncbi:MAG: hypothetical protein ACLFQP_03595 [Halothece sp.]
MTNEEWIREFLLKKLGGKLGGGGTVAVLGLLSGGLPGAVIGAVGGSIVETLIEVGYDYYNRRLSRREEVRIAYSLFYMLSKIHQHQEQNDELRNDDFFEPSLNDRSKAAEIMDAVLSKVRQEYQEKKNQLISNIYCNVAYENISVEEIHHIIRVADELTYRELCILSLITKKENSSDPMRKIGLVFPTNFALDPKSKTYMNEKYNIYPYLEESSDFYYLHRELMKLNSLGLMGDYYTTFKVDQDKLPHEIKKGDTEHSVFTYSFSPKSCPFAYQVSKIMSLEDIPDDDEDLKKLKYSFVPKIILHCEPSPEDSKKSLIFIEKPDFLVTNIPTDWVNKGY